MMYVEGKLWATLREDFTAPLHSSYDVTRSYVQNTQISGSENCINFLLWLCKKSKSYETIEL